MLTRALLVLATLLFVSSPALADCKFVLNIHNKTGKKIKIKDVQYKLHKSTWETLDFGAGLDLNNGDHSFQDKKNNKFSVWNAVATCSDAEYRFKFTYNCYDDNAGPQTRHSDLLHGNKQAVLATQANAIAKVSNCSGGVTFGTSMTEAGL